MTEEYVMYKLNKTIVELCDELGVSPKISVEAARRLSQIDNCYFEENVEEARKEEARLNMHINFMQRVECMAYNEAEEWVRQTGSTVLSKCRGELGGYYYIVEYWNSLVEEHLVKQINSCL
jgi:hypothetical protein